MPYILVQDDIAQNEDLSVREEECNCAPAYQIIRERPMIAAETPMIHSDIYSGDLPAQHSFMVNSIENGGVVVANQPARNLWQLFDRPRSANSLVDQFGPDGKNLAIRLHHYGLLKVFGETKPSFKKVPQVLSAWIHITNECNLRCSYCYINKSHDFMSREIGIAAVDAVIRSAQGSDFDTIRLKFAGGEATLSFPLILELDTYAKEQTARVGLNYEAVLLSNGVALSETQINELLSRHIRLVISLDGVGEYHDRQRVFVNGVGSFAWVERTLNKLRKCGLIPFISVTVTGRNVFGLPSTVDFLLEQELPFNLNFYRDLGAMSRNLQLENKDLAHYLLAAFEQIEKRLPPYSLLNILLDRSNLVQLHNKACGVGDSYLAVSHRGQIAKCHAQMDHPLTSVSDPNPLTKLIEDQTQFRNISVDEKEGCKECQWRYWCAGGCPLLTYASTGRYDVKSPFCDVYQTMYPYLLRLEGLRLMKYGGIPYAT
jgi:uncharacterized protein